MRGAWRTLAAMGALGSVAGAAHANSPEAPALRGQATVGVEVSDADSRRVDAAVDWYLPRDWEVGVSAAKGEYGLADGDLSSTAMGAALRRNFDAFQLGLGFIDADIEDLSSTRGVHLTTIYWQDDWRFKAGLGSRLTELAATEFEEDLGGDIGLADGISRCEARSLALQAQADFMQPGWRAYARVSYFDYRDVDCELTITSSGNGNGNGPPAHARGRALGRRLAGNTLGAVVDINPRLVPRDAMLLESTLAVGATVSRAGWQFGGELSRDVEWLRGDDFFTAVTYANREISRTWNLEFSLGYATSSLEDSLFAGIRLSASIY
jgi:hypothetical protein